MGRDSARGVEKTLTVLVVAAFQGDIRSIADTDLQVLMEIASHSFEEPWPLDGFKKEMMRAWAHVDVLVVEERVVAFCHYWIVQEELQLLNIATHRDHRRRSFAAHLMEHLNYVGKNFGCTLLHLEVRRSNTAAIHLYEKHGFKEVGIRKKYYAKEGEDAVLMTKDLANA